MSAKISHGTKDYRAAIAALFLGGIVTFGAEYCVQPIIPTFTKTFGLEPAAASLAVSLGTAGMACSMILIAVFAKILPRKIIMTIALTVASLLAVAMSFCENFGTILILRFLQGMVLAGFPAMAVAYIVEEFDMKIVGAVTGIYIAGTSFGGLCGRIALSYFTDVFDWRTALEILGGFYVITAIAFFLILPNPKHKVDFHGRIASVKEFLQPLKSSKLVKIYLIAALAMGGFVCTYNFISYVLLEPPYSLTQTQVGFVYVLFLAGTLSSTVMGRLSDRIGNGKTVLISLLCMIIGILFSILPSLGGKLIGVALVTYGFFGTHSAACSWAEKSGTGDKARISAMYMFLYYVGASVIGTAGGKFLTAFGWNGVVGFLFAVIAFALILNIKLLTGKK